MDMSVERKLEIFVGATKRDLGPARQAIVNAILRKGHIPCVMELWNAGEQPPPEVIQRKLERCDVHIILIGSRYGSRVPEGGVSFTEWEYQESKGKRPILPFLLDEEALEKERTVETDPIERDDKQRARLDGLRQSITTERYVRKFRNDPEGLKELEKDAILAIDELARSDKRLEGAGWIRDDSPEAQAVRDVTNNEFLRRELNQLRQFSTLGERVNLDVGSKRMMAKAFWYHMHGKLWRNRFLNLFFESGSTLAYLSDEFGPRQPGDGSQWHIRTNNVLSLVYFDLHTSIDASRFPAGVPDPKNPYGAIFPSDWRHLNESPPTRPRSLHSGRRGATSEKKAVEEMRRHFVARGPKQIALATASGLDLDNEEPHFRGPHVGSHSNMLFKRAIFTSEIPVVLFLSAEKLGNPFIAGKCFPVFGPDDPWSKAIVSYPIAVCVGYEWPKSSGKSSVEDEAEAKRRNEPSCIIEKLSGLDLIETYFHDKEKHETGRRGAILCVNRAFSSLIPNY